MSYINTSLGDLSNPLANLKPLKIKGLSKVHLINLLKKIITIRLVEYKIANAKKEKLIGGPVHLGIGQEAIAVGVSTNLKKNDFIFGAHRSHSHLLALGSDIRKLFAEILGRKNGHSKGMGGSMHLIDKSVGFQGSVPIVSGTVPLAVGTALASKLKNENCITVVYLGDGAIEEGVVHESLNLAKINNLPILFVIENNLFASHMHISIRQPSDLISRFALANEISHRLVDGNDVISVEKNSADLIGNIINGYGPCFLEGVTYRWMGHVDWRDDIDVGVSRSKEDINNWKKRDPLERLSNQMISEKIISHQYLSDLKNNLKKLIDKEWENALNDPYPQENDLLKNVYSE